MLRSNHCLMGLWHFRCTAPTLVSALPPLLEYDVLLWPFISLLLLLACFLPAACTVSAQLPNCLQSILQHEDVPRATSRAVVVKRLWSASKCVILPVQKHPSYFSQVLVFHSAPPRRFLRPVQNSESPRELGASRPPCNSSG